MNLKELPHIQERLPQLVKYTSTPEARVFDCTEIYSCLSEENKKLLEPIQDKFNIYLNLLKGTGRWEQHTYQKIAKLIHDNDYVHTLKTLEKLKEIQDLGVQSINFSDSQLMDVQHDGGEGITGDMSINHPPEMDSLIKLTKEFEPRGYICFVLRFLSTKDTFKLRSKLKNLYKRYENRMNNPKDKEAHLVKFVDILQGDEFGLQNVYSKKILAEVYGSDKIPTDSDSIVFEMLNREFAYLNIVLGSIDNLDDKRKIFDYYVNKQFCHYNNPEYGYQHLYEHFLPKIAEISSQLKS